jgi:transposase
VYKVQAYEVVRRAILVDGKSQRQIAKELGVHRGTIRRMLRHSSPPGYQRSKSPVGLKLNHEHKVWIDTILVADKKVHVKQRHTATRIWQRLKDERSFTGGYTIVRQYIAFKRTSSQEMFVPLIHDAGEGQADFGEADAYIQEQKVRLHFFCMHLPHSDAIFIKAYMAENTESFCDGHASAFLFFGGVPRNILYDNTKIAIAKVLGHGKRKKTEAFSSLQSHYLFDASFANVGRGNEKGNVEGLVRFARRNFMVPVPHVNSLDELNQHLEKECLKRQDYVCRGHTQSIQERLKQEILLALPLDPYVAVRVRTGRVNSMGLVRFENNDYSVPTRIGRSTVIIKGYVNHVIIIHGNTVVAEHLRCYGKHQTCFNPLHYLRLLERKAGAFDQAAPLKKWNLPPVFDKIRQALEKRDGKNGTRAYIRILQHAQTYSINILKRVLEEVWQTRTISEDAILHRLQCYIGAKSLQGSTQAITSRSLPLIHVPLTSLSDYNRLLTGEPS